MTGGRVAEIRGRLRAATPGPWFREYSDVVTSGYDPTDTTEEPTHMRIVKHAPHLDSRDRQGIENADLIANAPADLAYLLETLDSWQGMSSGLIDVVAARNAEIEALRGRLAAVEALHRPSKKTRWVPDPDCAWGECKHDTDDFCPEVEITPCVECSELATAIEGGEYFIAHPCATARAALATGEPISNTR